MWDCVSAVNALHSPVVPEPVIVSAKEIARGLWANAKTAQASSVMAVEAVTWRFVVPL